MATNVIIKKFNAKVKVLHEQNKYLTLRLKRYEIWNYETMKYFNLYIYIYWEGGEESLEKFLNKLNTFHPTIKFTAEYSKETINFLDVNIRLVVGELMTDLFVKPTDTYQFLDPSFSHSYHCKKGVPGSIEFVLTTKVLINAATI